MKNIVKLVCYSIVTAVLIATPGISRADDSTNAPATTPAPKKKSLPYHGKVASVDAQAMTFTVGTTTINVTSRTKITKDGEPGVFADITVGETVRGAYKKDDDGKYNASSVRIGAAKKPAPATSSTNAPPTQ